MSCHPEQRQPCEHERSWRLHGRGCGEATAAKCPADRALWSPRVLARVFWGCARAARPLGHRGGRAFCVAVARHGPPRSERAPQLDSPSAADRPRTPDSDTKTASGSRSRSRSTEVTGHGRSAPLRMRGRGLRLTVDALRGHNCDSCIPAMPGGGLSAPAPWRLGMDPDARRTWRWRRHQGSCPRRLGQQDPMHPRRLRSSLRPRQHRGYLRPAR